MSKEHASAVGASTAPAKPLGTRAQVIFTPVEMAALERYRIGHFRKTISDACRSLVLPGLREKGYLK
jgi:hypothetical protein